MTKKIVVGLALVMVLFGGFTTYYVNVRKNTVDEKVVSKDKSKISKKTLSKKAATQINAEFYSHEKVQSEAEMALVGYPATFSKLLKQGELTIIGEITGLKSYVFESHPYTVANVYVNKVLRGDTSKLGKTIRVMFVGGNVTKKEMLAPVADKSFIGVTGEEANSDEIVTVEYAGNRLPQAGEKVALILSKAPSGANNIPGKFWSPIFANKATFFQDSDGQYRRIPEQPSIGGSSDGTTGQSQNQFNQEDDEKMNKGMNDLINKA